LSIPSRTRAEAPRKWPISSLATAAADIVLMFFKLTHWHWSLQDH
jgi:hypothetical protein